MNTNALLIEWNPNTGKRAGNINPKDPGLNCNGWQNMDVIPAIELRTITDDRDIKKYVTLKGVTVLYGPDEINEAIEENFPSKFVIDDEFIFQEHFKQKKIDICSLPDDREKRLQVLKETHGLIGILKKEKQKV